VSPARTPLGRTQTGIDTFVNKLELIARDTTRVPRLTRTDVERAYTGAFLSFLTYYENAWERLFLGLLVGTTTHPRPVVPLIEVRSAPIARKVVTGRGRGYVDWLPADRSIDLAKIFLRGGRPFTDIPGGDKSILNRYMTVRNALAHDSHYALDKFKRDVIQGHPLPPAECRPAGYLRGSHTIGQTRMNLALSELTLVMRRLCS